MKGAEAAAASLHPATLSALPHPGIDLDDSRGLYDLMDDSPAFPARVAESPPKKKTRSPRKK